MARGRIVLFHPISGDWDWYIGPTLPLGLLSAACYAEAEFDVRIIDQRLHLQNWPEALRSELTDDALLAGFSCMTGAQITNALEAARYVKSRMPRLPILFGGTFPTLATELILREECVDAAVLGEGEKTLLEVARSLRDGGSLGDVAGLALNSDGGIVATGHRAFIDLAHAPEVPYHLVDMKYYLEHFRTKNTLPIETSRGCPWSCRFCYNPAFHKRRWRSQPAEVVARRVRFAKERYGVKTCYFFDDNFFLDRRRALAIAESIKGLGLNWYAHGLTIADAEDLTPDDLGSFAKSGCIELGIGVESGSPRILELIGKDFSPDQAIQVNRKLAKSGIHVTYGFMIGFPGEAEDEVRQTVDLALRILRDNQNSEVNQLNIFIPYPGTEIMPLAREWGFEPPDRAEGWSGYSHLEADMPWLNDREKRVLSSLSFVSLFFPNNKLQKLGIGGWLARALAGLYSRIALWRATRMNFRFMIERPLFMLLRSFILRNRVRPAPRPR